MIKIRPIVYKIVVKQQLAPSVIAETNDVQLRSNFQQMRNQDEQRQYQLALTAMQKGYYKPKSSKLSPN
jgi:spore coat protein CotF